MQCLWPGRKGNYITGAAALCSIFFEGVTVLLARVSVSSLSSLHNRSPKATEFLEPR